MKINARLTLILLAVGLLCSAPASGCEYSIRDVAFVCFDAERYRLFFFVGKDTPQDVRSTIDRVAYTVLLDSNVSFEIVDADARPAHPALKFLPEGASRFLPAAVLVPPFPGLDPLPLPLPRGGAAFREELWTVLQGVVVSPMRAEIVRNIVPALAVVLLVEGDDSDLNREAAAVAADAVERIARMMTAFPKPVHAPAPLEEPPRLVVLPRESAAKERESAAKERESAAKERESAAKETVLLWSLGLDARPAREPQIVVLHGRCRQVGWTLGGESIDSMTLARILSVIGQDCECTLPREWLRGRMIPARWDDDVRTALIPALGFDPQSPLVMSDVARIAGIRPTGPGFGSADGALGFGYREMTVAFEEEAAVQQDEAAVPPDEAAVPPDEAAVPPDESACVTPLPADAPPGEDGFPPAPRAPVEEPDDFSAGGALKNLYLLLGGMVLVVLICIVVVVIRGRGRF